MRLARLGFLSPPSLHLALTILAQKTTQEVQSRRLQVSILVAPFWCHWRRSSRFSPPSRSYRFFSVSKTSFIKWSRSTGFRRGSRWVTIRLVTTSEGLTWSTSRRGRPRNYCRTDISHAGKRLESSCKRRSRSGFAIYANASQEGTQLCGYKSS